jgi:diguanylate cyclase (GGDEF)-like protein/PAS domain S-box-containing protein
VQSAVAEVLARCSSLDEARPLLLEAVGSEGGFDLGAAWTLDPGDATLSCVDTWARPGLDADPIVAAWAEMTLGRGQGLPGEALAAGEPRFLPVKAEPHPRRALALRRAGLAAGLAVPVRRGDRVIGVAEFYGRDLAEPDPDALSTVAAIVAQLEQFLARSRAQAALRQSEALMSAVVNAALDSVVTVDHEGTIVEFNPAAERTFGHRREDAIGQSLAEVIVAPVDRERCRKELGRTLAALGLLGERKELTAVRASGATFPVEVALARADLPGPPMYTMYLRDVSERRWAERRLRDAEAMYRQLVEQIPAVTYVDAVDEMSSTIYISPQIEALVGYSPEEWERDPAIWLSLLHPEDKDRVEAEHVRTNATGEPFVSEYRLVHRDGHEVWVQDEARLVSRDDGRVKYWQGVMIDVTERKRAEKQVEYLAFNDQLTGLPNRTTFEQLLGLDLARARRHGLAVAVLYMDLDNFKLVNDSLGHEAGDELLRQVGSRLDQVSRDTDLVARLGGDEFLLLLSDLERDGVRGDAGSAARHTAEAVARRIHDALRSPFDLAGTELYASASIGISIFPLDATDGSSLLKNADAAMYRSKRSGPGGHVVFPAERDDARVTLSVATRLRRAVDEGSFVLHYQPIVDLIEGDLIGVEALIRWNDRERGLVPPADFLPLAEEMGLMEPIGDWVLDELFRQAAEWRDEGLTPEVSFNLSPRQLWQPDLEEKILGKVRSTGCDPSAVIVEITESTVMTDPDRTSDILRSVRQHGIRFAIDDFGTGYSALSRLTDLPVDILKIDRSFVKDLPGSPEAGTMVRTIIQLAHNLKMTPLAEGIETEAQWRYLVEHGCVLGQGFFMSQPLPGEAVAVKAFGVRPPAEATTSPGA